MKKILPFVLAAAMAGPATAGNLTEPEMEPEVLAEETAATSSGGILIPIFLLVFLAAAASSGGGGGGA